MKNTKKMMSLIGFVAMVCSTNSFAKEKPRAPEGAEVIRSLDWASDAGTYPNLQVKADCFQRDAKHVVWQTSLRNSADRILEVRGPGKAVDIDSQATVDGGSFEGKSCDKPLVMKLEARIKGEKQQFEIAYTDGAVVAREKQAKHWGGFAMALAMAGTSVMGVQAVSQAQFGATAALRAAGAVRADQMALVQGALSQAASAHQAAADLEDAAADDAAADRADTADDSSDQ
jgi:hypothetical protein